MSPRPQVLSRHCDDAIMRLARALARIAAREDHAREVAERNRDVGDER
jgi:hypothetical protein